MFELYQKYPQKNKLKKKKKKRGGIKKILE